MGWFTDLCRNLGLMVHNVKNPDANSDANREDDGQGVTKQEVRREVEEEQVDETTTLRRTTIEEVEIRRTPRDKRIETDDTD